MTYVCVNTFLSHDILHLHLTLLKTSKHTSGPPTTTGAIKAARVGISHHLLRNVILAKTSSTTWPCHLQKYFTVSPSIFWGGHQQAKTNSKDQFFNTLQIRHSSDCACMNQSVKQLTFSVKIPIPNLNQGLICNEDLGGVLMGSSSISKRIIAT